MFVNVKQCEETVGTCVGFPRKHTIYTGFKSYLGLIQNWLKQVQSLLLASIGFVKA